MVHTLKSRVISAGKWVGDNAIMCLFLVAIFLWAFNPFREFDVWYHLKTGEYILGNLSVPTRDIFSYTAQGAIWVTHSWVPEVIFFLVYKISGMVGIAAVPAVAAVITFALVFYLAQKLGANKYVTLALFFLIPYLRIFPLWVSRPQIFSYLFIVVEILCLETYLRNKDKRILYFLPVLLWVWANSHASVTLGLGVLIGYCLFNRSLIVPAFVSVGLSFLNPNTYHIFIYSSLIREVVQTLRVDEWLSILVYSRYVGTQIFFVLLALLNIFFLYSLARKRIAENLRFAGLVLGFSALPFISVRHLVFLPLVIFPILSAQLSKSQTIKGILEKVTPATLGVLFAVLGFIFVIGGVLRFPHILVDQVIAPVRAVDFILREGIRGPIFNYYNEGGYLIWRLWPEQKVFIDGRSEVYAGQPLQDFLAILMFRNGWQDIVNEKYKVNYVLIATRSFPRKFLEKIFEEFGKIGFKPVYLDDAHAVLLRDNKKNAEIIKKFAIKTATPTPMGR